MADSVSSLVRVLVVGHHDSAVQRRLAKALEAAGFIVEAVSDDAAAFAEVQKRATLVGPPIISIVVTSGGAREPAYDHPTIHREDRMALARDEISRLARAVADSFGSSAPAIGVDLLGDSPSMRLVGELVKRVAAGTVNVLVTGESGVGKELVAQAIHRHSPRSRAPLIDVNCAAFTPTLMESALFGHEKGAYTGADARSSGLLEAASGGTLLLDEIGELPIELQAKFLRVLETGSFFRVGGTRPVTVDVRVVAVTNRDLRREVADGNFRQDLYYRLNTVNIHVPPLRERPQDIMRLARGFAGIGVEIVAGAEELLSGYDWPGNVRELKNAIEGATVLSGGRIIDAVHLPRDLRDARMMRAGGVLRDQEREAILEALRAHGWKRAQAAERLGISIKTLYRKIRTYSLEEEESLV